MYAPVVGEGGMRCAVGQQEILYLVRGMLENQSSGPLSLRQFLRSRLIPSVRGSYTKNPTPELLL